VLLTILFLPGGLKSPLIELASAQEKIRPADDGPARPQASPAGIILTMHGSNTIGAELAPALADAFLRKRGATEVRTINRGTDEVEIEGRFPDGPPKSIAITAHGSTTAFTDLADRCDIGNSSRAIKSEEAQHLISLGDMTSPAAEHVLGLDGIAIIVNSSNSIASLSKQQIRGIFNGYFTDWKQLGRKEPGPINVYARDDKSGTWDTFKTLVLDPSLLISSSKRFEDSRQLSDAIASDRNGIGFIGLPYIRNAKALSVSDSGTRAIYPTQLTVATEDYPLSRRLYLYTSTEPRNPVVHEFVSFALSQQGQEIVSQVGFVGQTVNLVKLSNAPASAPENYKKLTVGAARLPLDFRFRPGSADLDNKALEDLRRIVEFVSSPLYSGQRIVLLGFADNRGAELANLRLSRERAAIVSTQLQTRGINVFTIDGFGSQLPVASNESPDGREKNRRVEVWLRP
jgi:phosphate transport system substrate-binding protein